MLAGATNGDLKEDATDILSPLPTLSRHAGAQAHANRFVPTGFRRRILANIEGASFPRWGSDPSVAACKLDATWDDLIDRHADGTGALFETGGLGGLMEALSFEVGPCDPHLLTKRGRVCTGKRPSQSTSLYNPLPG